VICHSSLTVSYVHREYYFSPDSLISDTTIRSYLDEAGYIPIAFVCNFPDIVSIGAYYEDILAALQNSALFEIDFENETMRLHDWQKVCSPPCLSALISLTLPPPSPAVAHAQWSRRVRSPSIL
jgi:hypothetical protein